MLPCGAARWEAALAAAIADPPAHLRELNSAAASRSTWAPRWASFFAQLQLPSEATHSPKRSSPLPHTRRFDLVPPPLLRSMAQHWMDAAVLAETRTRLAQVCPAAHTTPPTETGGAASSSPPPAAMMEPLVATWTAHVLLAAIQPSPTAAASTVGVVVSEQRGCGNGRRISAVLAECVMRDVAPVLNFLCHFAGAPPPVRTVRCALMLLLCSCVDAWGGSAASTDLSAPERALAVELCCSIDALRDDHDTLAVLSDEHESPSRAALEAQVAGVRASLAVGASATGESATEADESGGQLLKFCTAWVASGGRSQSPPPSLFAGVDEEVHRRSGSGAGVEDVDPDVLDRVNGQLNNIAVGGAKRGGPPESSSF
ncbi:hypothetical protein NESM_000356100 [Novymonas esmeraldas]|uniref:Uncharacterized protein n=1 Tax=Novymonas esmeraldas TaxID=1808958 RepID=A0AAW0EMJ2_9TRYP